MKKEGMYTPAMIARIIKRSKQTVISWIKFVEQTKPTNPNLKLPEAFKGGVNGGRLYEKHEIDDFKKFAKFVKKHKGVLAEWNCEHAWSDYGRDLKKRIANGKARRKQNNKESLL